MSLLNIFKVFNTLFVLMYHSAIFCMYAYTHYWLVTNIPIPMFGGYSIMLTTWGHIIQIIYFLVAIIYDLTTLVKRTKSFRGHQPKEIYSSNSQMIAFTVSYCYGFLVTILFWGIMSIKRDILIPKLLALHYPMAANIVQHVCPAFLMWIEMLIQPKRNQPFIGELFTILSIGIAYIAWTFYASMKDSWPYPFQRHFNTTQHVLMDVFATTLLIILLLVKRKLVKTLYSTYQEEVKNVINASQLKRKTR